MASLVSLSTASQAGGTRSGEQPSPTGKSRPGFAARTIGTLCVTARRIDTRGVTRSSSCGGPASGAGVACGIGHTAADAAFKHTAGCGRVATVECPVVRAPADNPSSMSSGGPATDAADCDLQTWRAIALTQAADAVAGSPDSSAGLKLEWADSDCALQFASWKTRLHPHPTSVYGDRASPARHYLRRAAGR